MHLGVYCECVDEQVGLYLYVYLGVIYATEFWSFVSFHHYPMNVAAFGIWENLKNYLIPHWLNLVVISLNCIFFMLFVVFYLEKKNPL